MYRTLNTICCQVFVIYNAGYRFLSGCGPALSAAPLASFWFWISGQANSPTIDIHHIYQNPPTDSIPIRSNHRFIIRFFTQWSRLPASRGNFVTLRNKYESTSSIFRFSFIRRRRKYKCAITWYYTIYKSRRKNQSKLN